MTTIKVTEVSQLRSSGSMPPLPGIAVVCNHT
ncbi:MAG: hypothetical protein JWL60_824, partial [Gemmatimonadetes bacterium]|nr:hypothetical protein [Gemmatimonadota bacterium]